NAGLMAVPFELTRDGMESQFQVNFVANMLLVELLRDYVAQGGYPGARILVTSTEMYQFCKHRSPLEYADKVTGWALGMDESSIMMDASTMQKLRKELSSH